MRQMDREEPQPLGKPIRKEPERAKPADQWEPVPGRRGIERDQDGKLRTNLPENGRA